MLTEAFPALVIDDRALRERRYDGPAPKPPQDAASVQEGTGSLAVARVQANAGGPAATMGIRPFP